MVKHIPDDEEILELIIGTKDSQLDLDIAVELEEASKSIAKEIDLMIIKEIEKELEDDVADWHHTIKEDKYKWYKRNGIYSKKNDIEPKSLLDIIYKHHIILSKKE